MLEQSIKDQVKGLFANVKNKYTFQVEASSNHPKRNELTNLLENVASCTDNIGVELLNGEGLCFKILKNGNPTSVTFRAIPTGHEFTSLLLAVLNLDGIGKNLPDDAVRNKIKSLRGKVELKSYISLTCTNCPDVVQALNVMSFINPNISHEIIDGGMNQEEVEKLNIQAVPTVFVNGEQLHVGRSSLGELLAKLEEKVGTESVTSTGLLEKHYDVVVAGGGPAGVSAAIYSARKGFSVAIVAGHIGGQVTETVSIENMISVAKTTGAKLSADMKLHLTDYNIEILENRMIENVELKDGLKYVKTSLNETFITPSLIISTGASWKKLGVPGEQKYIGNGVAFCTHCDGPFYKSKKVAVVGGGNSGLEAAIDLSSIALEVTVLEYADTLKGDKVLQNKLVELANVKIITNAQTLEVQGDDTKVTALKFKHRTTGLEETIDLDGIFVQIGLKPNSGVFSQLVKTNRMGEIIIDAHCRTNIPGIYAAGDVTQVPFKQIVIAMGEGSKAALSSFEDSIKGLQLAVFDEETV